MQSEEQMGNCTMKSLMSLLSDEPSVDPNYKDNFGEHPGRQENKFQAENETRKSSTHQSKINNSVITQRRNFLSVSKQTFINSSTGSSTSGVSSFGSRSDFRVSNRNVKLKDSFDEEQISEESGNFIYIYRSFSFKKAIDSNTSKLSKETLDDLYAGSSNQNKTVKQSICGGIFRVKTKREDFKKLLDRSPPPYTLVTHNFPIEDQQSSLPSNSKTSELADKMDATPQNLTPRKICLSTLAEEEAVTILPKQKDLKSENTSKKIEPIQSNGPTTTCLMESNSCKMKELPKPPLTPITISTSSDKCIYATKTSQDDSTTTRRQSLREMRLMNPLISEPLGYDVDDNNYNEKTNTITFSEKFGESDYLMGDEEWLSKLSPEEIQGKFEVQSLAFKIDQDSLRQRFENHYRAREVAEQNIESELDIIKTELKSLTESSSVEVSAFPEIAKLNRSIEILEKSIDRLSSLSEVYGAVYQELRSSQAVMTAVKHVDNLKQEMKKNQSKFMTAKKVLLENNLWDEESAGVTEPSIPSRLNSFQSRLKEKESARQKFPPSLENSKENRRRASLAAVPKNIKLNQIFETPNIWREESNSRPISRTNLDSKSSGNSKEHEQILDKSFKRGISLPSRCENTSPYKRLSRVHEQSKLEAFREQFKSFSRSLDSSDAGVGLVLLATTIFIVILVLLSIKYSLQ